MVYGYAYHTWTLSTICLYCAVSLILILFVFFLQSFTILHGEYILSKIQINLLRGKIVWNTDYGILLSVCVCVCVRDAHRRARVCVYIHLEVQTCHVTYVEVTGTTCGSWFSSLCGLWELNSGQQVWYNVLSPTKLPCRSCLIALI